MLNIKKSIFALAFLTVIPSFAYAEKCENNFSPSTLKALKEDKFEIQDAEERNNTAIELLSCVGHPDPDVRDGIVYEAFSHWLRNELLEPTTVKTLYESLIQLLNTENKDKDNFTQPFASLVLAEVVRVDRVTPYLSAEERQKVVDVSTQYMRNITDYRGFIDKEGWRHAVAHTSDIFLQLALNKNVSKKQLNQMLEAIVSQTSPSSSTPHLYVHGESKRLATAFAYIVLRGEESKQEISNILDKIAAPSPFADWGSVYKSEKGLAKLHNTRAFIYSLLAITGQSKNPNLVAIQPTLIRIIRELG